MLVPDLLYMHITVGSGYRGRIKKEEKGTYEINRMRVGEREKKRSPILVPVSVQLMECSGGIT